MEKRLIRDNAGISTRTECVLPQKGEDYDFRTEPCHKKNIFFVKRINKKKYR